MVYLERNQQFRDKRPTDQLTSGRHEIYGPLKIRNR